MAGTSSPPAARLGSGPSWSWRLTSCVPEGTITFGPGHELRFRTVGAAPLAPCPDPHLTQASVISEVTGGTGQFDGACGQIVSNILVSDTGEVTDNHLGVIFVEATP